MIVFGIFMLISSCGSVSIDHLMVPPVVEEGEDHVILDCPFQFNLDEENYLELKYYFNDSPTPFYQWIVGDEGESPQVDPQILSSSYFLFSICQFSRGIEASINYHTGCLKNTP